MVRLGHLGLKGRLHNDSGNLPVSSVPVPAMVVVVWGGIGPYGGDDTASFRVQLARSSDR